MEEQRDNEVRIDLEKFLALTTQIEELKDKLEETYSKQNRRNPFIRSIQLARAIDAWRPFPRIFIISYIYMLYRSIEWFIALPDPSTAQAGLISVVVGAGAAWFGLYAGTGGAKKSGRDSE